MYNEELLKKVLKITGEDEKYVVLKKDDLGFYIEYAFKEGAPHDNRCLSWYDSYQENAYVRNGWFRGLSPEGVAKRKNDLLSARLLRVGKIYRLSQMTCGYECAVEGEQRCTPGHPKPNCSGINRGWTYDEPVKCACWYLEEEFNIDDIDFNLNFKQIEEIMK